VRILQGGPSSHVRVPSRNDHVRVPLGEQACDNQAGIVIWPSTEYKYRESLKLLLLLFFLLGFNEDSKACITRGRVILEGGIVVMGA
jgi:hypothetical protein